MRTDQELSIEEAVNFSVDEVYCKCGCGQLIIQPRLVWLLQLARDEAGVPFPINSWNRCLNYNRQVGSRDTSSHICGWAVDIGVKYPPVRYAVLEGLFYAEFPIIQVKQAYIHADLNPDKVGGIFLL